LPNRSGLEARKLGQEAEQRLARQNIERCRILSPLTGLLESVDVEVGENVTSGQRVARVVDLGKIEVALRVPASARSTIRVGDDVDVRSTGPVDRRWRAIVARISPTDDASTRTMTVFVEIEQDPQRPDGLAPGRFLRASVRSSQSEPRVVVPRRAMDGERVLLVRDGQVVSRPVAVDYEIEGVFPQFGLEDEQWVVLREPLDEGSEVIVNARRALPDGMRVQAVGGGEGEATAAGDPGDEVAP
jgi:RND family efflux transporter MFP subunit